MIAIDTASRMREEENKLFSKGITPIELMDSVGRFISDRLADRQNILIVCGAGNNAGDGYSAAVKMHESAKKVTVLLCKEKFSESGKYFYDKCLKSGVKCIYGYKDVDFDGYDVIVDCLYGIGFRGEISGEDKEIVERINSAKAEVISVDVPSGLNADNGTTRCAVKADKVYSVGMLKYGLKLNAGKDHAKKTEIVPIGFSGDECGKLFEECDCKEFLTERENDCHKGKFGYISIFGGSENFSGAVKLAGLASCAMRSGSGVVRLVVPDRIVDWVAPYVLESTLFNESDFSSALTHVSALGVGCGWGRNEDRSSLLKQIFEKSSCPIVLDADGLYAWKALGLPARENLVVTPHYSEMAHLVGGTVSDVLSDPVGVSTSFSRQHNCVTVLKGPSTIVTDGNDVIVTDRGCGGMATAGSGDVLLGIITSVIGQKYNNLLLSVAYATYLNGIAGEIAKEKYTDIGMTSSDTARSILEAIKLLRKCCGIN